MLKDMIKKILSGEGKKEPVDAESNSVMSKKKPGFVDEMRKKAHGSKSPAGREALIALEDTE